MSASLSLLHTLPDPVPVSVRIQDDIVLLDRPMALMCGEILEAVRIAYRLVGNPDPPTNLAIGGKGGLTLSDSIYGHDAFLKEVNAVSGVIKEHLESEQ